VPVAEVYKPDLNMFHRAFHAPLDLDCVVTTESDRVIRRVTYALLAVVVFPTEPIEFHGDSVASAGASLWLPAPTPTTASLVAQSRTGDG
jgi:hypothetical protein